jgi:hypothetical protein
MDPRRNGVRSPETVHDSGHSSDVSDEEDELSDSPKVPFEFDFAQEEDHGDGDIGDLQQWVELASRLGGTVWRWMVARVRPTQVIAWFQSRLVPDVRDRPKQTSILGIALLTLHALLFISMLIANEGSCKIPPRI